MRRTTPATAVPLYRCRQCVSQRSESPTRQRSVVLRRDNHLRHLAMRRRLVSPQNLREPPQRAATELLLLHTDAQHLLADAVKAARLILPTHVTTMTHVCCFQCCSQKSRTRTQGEELGVNHKTTTAAEVAGGIETVVVWPTPAAPPPCLVLQPQLLTQTPLAARAAALETWKEEANHSALATPHRTRRCGALAHAAAHHPGSRRELATLPQSGRSSGHSGGSCCCCPVAVCRRLGAVVSTERSRKNAPGTCAAALWQLATAVQRGPGCLAGCCPTCRAYCDYSLRRHAYRR